MRRNNLSIVISAPSGAEKTTIINELLAQYGELEFSISSTTRPMRAGEAHGKNYYFISEDEFITRRDNDEFFEWAEVHGNFYCTQKKEIDRIRALGKIPIFDVDVQGSRSMKDRFTMPYHHFIIPPSLKILEERLKNRNNGFSRPDRSPAEERCFRDASISSVRLYHRQ
jgi:guanylate kinase